MGDFQPADALAKIKKYFGDIPAQPTPPAPDLSEPKQTGERRKTIEDAFAHTPRLDIAFKTPPGNTSRCLRARRFIQRPGRGPGFPALPNLVKEKEFAVNVFCYVDEHRGPSTFNVVVLARPGTDLKEVEKVVYAELDAREIRANGRLGASEDPNDGAPSDRAATGKHSLPRLPDR